MPVSPKIPKKDAASIMSQLERDQYALTKSMKGIKKLLQSDSFNNSAGSMLEACCVLIQEADIILTREMAEYRKFLRLETNGKS